MRPTISISSSGRWARAARPDTHCQVGLEQQQARSVELSERRGTAGHREQEGLTCAPDLGTLPHRPVDVGRREGHPAPVSPGMDGGRRLGELEHREQPVRGDLATGIEAMSAYLNRLWEIALTDFQKAADAASAITTPERP